jgi:hypothetical protein
MSRPLALALALPLACGPSLARLERGHHYNEAICGAEERAFPEDQVRGIVRRALDPALHVAVVPREQLAGILGDGVPELDQVALLRVIYDSNTIPLSGFSAAVALRRAGATVDVTRADLERFAAVFKENIPGPRTVGPGAIESAAHTVGVIGAAVLTVASLGLLGGLLKRMGPGPRSRTEYPTESEIRAAAPRAAKLYDAVGHLGEYCRRTPGARCHTLAIIDRPPVEPADLAVTVRLDYTGGCMYAGIGEQFTIPLPPGPSLEARLAAVFGQDMRRLSELTGDAR